MEINKALMIVNPSSRRAAAAAGAAGDHFKGRGVALDIRQSSEPGQTNELIRQQAAGADCVILVGGDGTIHHALPALRERKIPLGVLPGGTANDFARALHLPLSIPEACNTLLEGAAVKVDLGEVNGKPFLNVAHIGLAARVASQTSGGGKRLLGILEYARSAIDLFGERRIFEATVRCNGEARQLRSIQLSVGNSPYFGGGNRVDVHSTPLDHQLYLSSIRPLQFWQLLMIAPLFRHGRGDSSHGIDRLQAPAFTVETPEPMTVTADGEELTQTPAGFRVIPQALEVIMARYANTENQDPRVLDERQVALQDVAVALHNAGEHYREAAELIDDESLRSRLRELGEARDEAGNRFDDCVRELGTLPRAPDPDRESLERLIEWLKAGLSPDKTLTLLSDCADRDEGVRMVVDDALEKDLPEAITRKLRELRNGLDEDIARLREMAEPSG